MKSIVVLVDCVAIKRVMAFFSNGTSMDFYGNLWTMEQWCFHGSMVASMAWAVWWSSLTVTVNHVLWPIDEV
jgi:hypothetical protein